VRKKEIKLPDINNILPKHAGPDKIKSGEKPKQESRPAGEFAGKDYSRISVHFITVVVVAWIYYILTR
jgi:hypothetical protein